MKPRLSQIRPEGTAGQYPKVNSTADGWTYDTPVANYGRDRLTAAGGETGLTLGATPVANSVLLWKSGSIMVQGTDYTISGATVTFTSGLTSGQVISTYYATTGTPSSSSLFSGYKSAVLTDTPLAYYRLDEASGTTMGDSSGNTHNGIYIGSPTLNQTGLLTTDGDKAAVFAANEYGSVTSAAWMTSAAFTVEAFIKCASSASTKTIGNRFATPIWAMDVNSAGLARFYVVNSATSTFIAASTARVDDSATHHVAGTFDGTNVKLYVDGALVATTAFSGTLNTGSPNMEVGRRSDGGYFTGTLDEFAFYGSALTATRIAAHYAAR